MNHHDGFRKACEAVCLCAVALALCQTAQAQEAAALKVEHQMAMVFSGGISLGSYQAGVSYTLVRQAMALRHARTCKPKTSDADDPCRRARIYRQKLDDKLSLKEGDTLLDGAELVTITGASAGNINAFLGAMTWCEGEPDLVRANENLFHDAWLNIGWSKLAPDRLKRSDYMSHFEDPLASADFPRPTADADEVDSPLHSKKWDSDDPVYTNEDFLASRQAYVAAVEHLKRRLSKPRYREGCDLTLGVIVSPTVPEKNPELKGVRTMRRVVPLRIKTDSKSKDCIEKEGQRLCPLSIYGYPPYCAHNGEETRARFLPLDASPLEQIAARHPELGNVLHVRGDTSGYQQPLDFERDIKPILEASSANQFGFAPVCLDHHWFAQGDEASTSCNGEALAGTRTAFFDGGTFDNIPLGLAMTLTREAHPPQPGAKTQVDYFYVDPDVLRDTEDSARAPENYQDLGFTFGLLGRIMKESRLYEVQGLARYRAKALRLDKPVGKRGFQVTSRYFPLLGNFLNAFGAFLHIDFRQYDYRVGLYDGLFNTSMLLLVRAGLATGEQDVQWGRFLEVFALLQEHLIGRDNPAQTAFVYRLLRQEMMWRTDDSLCTVLGGESCKIKLPRDIETLICSSPDTRTLEDTFERMSANSGRANTAQHELNVWAIQRTFLAQQEALEKLQQTASAQEILEAREASTDLIAFIAKLERDPIEEVTEDLFGEGDLNSWTHGTYDLLLRRFIEVEVNRREDKPGQPGSCLFKDESHKDDPEDEQGPFIDDLMWMARMGLASGMERSAETVDLDPSSVERLAAGRRSAFVGHLLPYFLTWDGLSSSVDVGYEPRLRIAASKPIESYFVSASGALRVAPFKGARPYGPLLARVGLGLGFDATGRVLDDMSFGGGLILDADGKPVTWGLEVTTHLIGDHLRVQLGLPIWDERAGFAPDAFKGFTINVGLANLNGLLYGLFFTRADDDMTGGEHRLTRGSP